MMRRLACLVLCAACTVAPPSDKRVVSTYQTTKLVARTVVVGDHLGAIPMEVPAYYLVADDNTTCEVDVGQYVMTYRGALASCDWTPVRIRRHYLVPTV